MLDFSNMQIQSINDVISLPSFINLSKLNFEITPIILVTICFLISILEGIAQIHGLETNLVRVAKTKKDIEEEKQAKEIEEYLQKLEENERKKLEYVKKELRNKFNLS